MRWGDQVRLRLRSLFRKGRVERELDDEFEFHLAGLIAEKLAQGMGPQEARYAAVRELGAIEQLKEECRDARGVAFIETFVQDLRFGLRQLRRSPASTSVALLSLALGIGFSAAIYSVVDGAFLHPFLKGNDSTVLISADFPLKKMKSWLFSVSEYLEIRNRTHVFSSVVAQREGAVVSLSDPPNVDGVWGAQIPAEAFEAAGATPLLGRAYTREEDRPGGPHVVVLSAALWQSHYNSDPAIVGKDIQINGERYTVLGVMPKRYRWMGAELWFPLQLNLADTDRSHRFLFVTASLRPGVTLDQARQELRGLAGSLSREYGGATPEYARWRLDALLVRDVIVGDLAPALFMLCGAVVVVLLITCANLGTLTLARAAIRRSEMTIRLAHGAGRARLCRQILTEGLLLAIAGSTAGVLVAWGGLRTMVSLIPREYIATEAEIGVNARVLVTVFLAALVMGALIALGPALGVFRLSLEDGLKAAGRSQAGEGPGRYFRRALVVCEIALAVVVLVGAGLMARSYRRIAALPLGFDPHGVCVMDVNLPVVRYPQRAQVSAFFEELVRRINAAPGIQSAEVVSQPPMAGWDVDTHDFLVEGRPIEVGGPPNADERVVGSLYFHLMGIRLAAGRSFDDRDRAGSLPVAIINQTMARLYWHDRSPIGSRIRLGHSFSRERLLSAEDAPGVWLTVVGVVNDARQRPDLVREIRPEIDLPFLQSADRIRNLSLMVRTSNTRGMLAAIHRHVAALDAQIPVYHFRTMDEIVADGEGPRRLALALLALFGGLALLLVVVGVYAVIACNVSQRTREVGLRTAMGASPRDIRRLILNQGVRLWLPGVVFGVALAGSLTRVMNSLLYGVGALDPVTFIAVSFLLGVVALFASYIPARRAVKVDPIVALRDE